MRPIYIYLISSVTIAACWMICAQQAHGQLSQVLADYKYDRPFQYAPSDPWTRSKLFKRHTKHFGFGYNCDGEECKRNSPHITWKTHTERDLPCRTGYCQRLKETHADIKQRIADGSCSNCAQNRPQSSTVQQLAIERPQYETIETVATETLPPKLNRRLQISPPVRTAGLESLDTRIK